MARENARRYPIRQHVLLPALRMADMWLRPRTEMLPLDSHFWRIRQDPHDALWSIALGLLNLVYLVLAVAGAWLLRHRYWPLALLLIYPVVRSLFLVGTGATEDRYTMECYPAILVLAGGFLAWWMEKRSLQHER